jgi:lipopolysaccharide/colanic/teichoic acid biosynthesis glycosyltransferase
MNLAEEQGLLSASEQSILLTFRQLDSGQKRPMLAGMGQKIHPSVRLMGAVIVHNGVTIDAGATVLGPAVIGSGARIGAGAVVAHSTIGPDSIVPPDTLVRDRAWFRGAAENGFGGSGRPLISFADRLKRVSLDTEPPAAVEWQTPPKDVRYQHGKRACDVLMAIAGLFVFSPAFVLAALAIWLESRGPIFFGDSRETVGGRVFKCWKFRTMLTGAHLAQRELKALDQIDGPHFKMDHDPRVTRVGKVLRALNLDEIPQLVNVLVGDMSLVGPRPSPFRENQVCVPWRAARLSVRPGITGFWQVCRHDRAAGDFHQWIEYDLLYIQHQSLWLDMKILAATLLTFGGKLKHVDALWLVSDSDTDAVVPAMSQPVPSQSQKAEREQVA